MDYNSKTLYFSNHILNAYIELEFYIFLLIFFYKLSNAISYLNDFNLYIELPLHLSHWMYALKLSGKYDHEARTYWIYFRANKCWY